MFSARLTQNAPPRLEAQNIFIPAQTTFRQQKDNLNYIIYICVCARDDDDAFNVVLLYECFYVQKDLCATPYFALRSFCDKNDDDVKGISKHVVVVVL